MKKERLAICGAVLLLAALAGVALPRLTPMIPTGAGMIEVMAAPASGDLGIHSGPLVTGMVRLKGDFDGMEHRYAAIRSGWARWTTSTITTTLALANPVGMRCCTQTITIPVGISTTFTLRAITMTGQYWEDVVGTIVAGGSVTPTFDVILHGW